ncbi:MAG: hypothetical protein IJS96_06940 [Schwartzia sp.]|nr:hypothetical protein [Schwartzia sp. (in: firmicutes)]
MDEGTAILLARRADYRQAEHYLLHYEQEMRAYREAKEEALSRPAGENIGRHGTVPHPTESAALQSVRFDETSDVYHWLRAVEITLRGLCDSKRFFVTLRRDAARANSGQTGRGRRGWVAFVQMRYGDSVGRYIGERTIKRWNAAILWRIVDIHLRLKNF